MWRRLNKLVGKAYDKKIDATGLGVFRICFSSVLFCEVVQLYYFRHLIFDEIPYVAPAEVDFGYGLLAWLGVLVFLALGWFTRPAAVMNYLFTLTFLGTISSFEYHMFYVYLATCFLLMFLPVQSALSIDRLRAKLRYSSTAEDHHPPDKVTALAYTVPLLISVGLVYMDSILHKLSSPMWTSGLGVWLPANLPMITHVDSSWLMDKKWLAIGAGYLTVIFEAVFIFLFWFRPFRIPLLIVGVGLHLGILMEFPIPWFALGVTAIYLLLVPLRWWGKLAIRYRTPKLRIFYDSDCSFSLRMRLLIQHFDLFGAVAFASIQAHREQEPALAKLDDSARMWEVICFDKKQQTHRGFDVYLRALQAMSYPIVVALFLRLPGIYQFNHFLYRRIREHSITPPQGEGSGSKLSRAPSTELPPGPQYSQVRRAIFVPLLALALPMTLALQLLVSYHYLPRKWRTQLGRGKNSVGASFVASTKSIVQQAKILFGVTGHPVFMDGHFRGYRHIVAVTYAPPNGPEVFLPIIDDRGMPDVYNYGAVFVKWTFRANNPRIKSRHLSRGIRDFTAFWAHQQGISLKNARFKVKVKVIDSPQEWTKGFLRKQLAKPWQDGGYVRWKNRRFHAALKNIERIR